MKKVSISAVSYTNSKAFVFGLENSNIIEKIDLQKDIPADCAEKLINNKVDIGLIPIATLPLVPNGEIIGQYCIGSDGAVNSVFLFSDLPLDEIKTIRLDAHSRTSNNLTKVLFHFYLKRPITYLTPDDSYTKEDAHVLIGDRTFGKTKQFKTVLDLGQLWKDFTGLPFVYAAWVANKKLNPEFITEFNDALKMGLDNLDNVIAQLKPIPDFNYKDYFYHNLKFNLDESKREAIVLFLNRIENLPK
ncbi:MAG: radical SAM protein [Pedobacter sp.]|nr:MAG: radical SAM protein [Pedobacter sp.]